MNRKSVTCEEKGKGSYHLLYGNTLNYKQIIRKLWTSADASDLQFTEKAYRRGCGYS